MAKIHELIPVESDKVAIANALVDESINTFTKKTDHFMGQIRRVTMYDETRQQENLTEHKEVVTTVNDKLDHTWEALAAAIDVSIAKENSNTSTEARADVVVNRKTILKDIPATALLALEKRLAALKNLYAAIPTLDPSFVWEPDTAAGAGMLRTVHPQESQKTEKSLEYKVLVEPTKEHPAQVREYTIDKPVGKITVDRTSGLVSPATKALWMRRIGDLATAVKEARQRANMAEVLPLPVANDIRTFIHAQ